MRKLRWTFVSCIIRSDKSGPIEFDIVSCSHLNLCNLNLFHSTIKLIDEKERKNEKNKQNNNYAIPVVQLNRILKKYTVIDCKTYSNVFLSSLTAEFWIHFGNKYIYKELGNLKIMSEKRGLWNLCVVTENAFFNRFT